MSDEKTSLPMTQQLIGVESTNTTRLLNLKSYQANLSTGNSDKTWIFSEVFKRKYMQHQVSLQSFKIWNVFPSVPRKLTLLAIKNSVLTEIPIYPGNWNPSALANYLTHKLEVIDPDTGNPDPLLSTVVTYDPYQLKFYFCPNGISLEPSEANNLLGFPVDTTITNAFVSYYPATVSGPKYINLYTNFTINNIPVDHFMASVPLNVPFGEFEYFQNYDNSQAITILDNDLQLIRIVLLDEFNRTLYYPDNLFWECTLAVQGLAPEGFAPLEA